LGGKARNQGDGQAKVRNEVWREIVEHGGIITDSEAASTPISITFRGATCQLSASGW
jgi:hypothetical protein